MAVILRLTDREALVVSYALGSFAMDAEWLSNKEDKAALTRTIAKLKVQLKGKGAPAQDKEG